MVVLDVAKTKKWMEYANEKIQAHKEYLTELDQAIGDGDHGINMSRGFQEVMAKIADSEYEHVSDVLKDVSMTLLSKVGGASGPLYGTAFLRMSTALKGKAEIDVAAMVSALEAALEGIKMRGKAEKGDKTLIDVWEPVIDYLKTETAIDLAGLESEAKRAFEATKELKAIKGRAAYLGERSIGHLDPGSASSYYIFAALSEVFQERG